LSGRNHNMQAESDGLNKTNSSFTAGHFATESS
jgi:hypothetical protein